MNSSEWAVPAISLIRLFVILIYGSAGIMASRWLQPRLSPLAKRLAIAFFVAQVLVLGVALTIEPSTKIERWLWDLDQERNIPATLASMQLAMAGSIAVITACSNATRSSKWYRLYLIAFGWLFLHLARDEFYGFHEFRPDVRLQYLILGAAAVLITLLIGWKSPRHKRVWHFLLVSGLAFSAFGAFFLEEFRSLCITLPWVGGCIWTFYYEEASEFLGVWLALVGMLGLFSAAIPLPNQILRLILYFFPLFTAVSLMIPFIMNHIAYRYAAKSVEIWYDADVKLQAYRLETRANSVDIQIFMSATSWKDFSKLGYSVHLVDQVTGESLAGTDKAESRLHDWRIALYDSATRYSQWLSVDASSIPTDRALWAVLTLWRERGDEFVRQKVRSSDMPLLGDTQVVLGELVLPADSSAAPSSEPLALFDGGYALEAVHYAGRAKAGETLDIAFAWSAAAKGAEDYTQFLHIGQSHSGDWQSYDRRPLGARLPSRLWYAGMSDEATWKVTLPADLASGLYEVFTGLYSASDQTRVPVTDVEGTPWLDNRVALGSLIIE